MSTVLAIAAGTVIGAGGFLLVSRVVEAIREDVEWSRRISLLRRDR